MTMSDTPSPLIIPPSMEPKEYHVLLMTAVVVTCAAVTEGDAAELALREVKKAADPAQIEWVVRYISEKPIELADLTDDEAVPSDASSDASPDAA